MSHENAKTQLNTFLQRHTKKAIGKADIVYTTQKHGDQFQTTVTLVCLGGEEFAGDMASNQKEAEKQAAAAALEHHAQDLAELPAQEDKKKGTKRKEPGAAPAVAAGENPCIANKVLLNGALGRILRRPLSKEDIQCENAKLEDGQYQTTLSMPNLPGEFGSLAWAGDVASTAKQAEANAAGLAYQALQEDPTYGPVISGPAAKKQKTGGAGAGLIRPPGKGGKKGGGKGMSKITPANCKWCAKGECWDHVPGKGKGKGKAMLAAFGL